MSRHRATYDDKRSTDGAMLSQLSGNDRDWIALLFDLAMAEMKRRRPDLQAKSESEIIEILTAEFGPADLADLDGLFTSDFMHIDSVAKASGRGGFMRAGKMRHWN